MYKCYDSLCRQSDTVMRPEMQSNFFLRLSGAGNRSASKELLRHLRNFEVYLLGSQEPDAGSHSEPLQP
jgi:hypothetical protein